MSVRSVVRLLPLADPRSAVTVASGLLLDRLVGRQSDTLAADLDARATWPADTLKAWRNARLVELATHAVREVPLYAERFKRAGLEPGDLADERALERLPPLTKDDVREAGDARVARSYAGKRMGESRTSGSTGRPLVLKTDAFATAQSRAVQRRAFRWFGVDPYAPRVMLLAAPRDHATRLKHKLVDLATGRRLYEFHTLNDAAVDAVLRTLRTYKPRFITAYPSVLVELCRRLDARGERIDGLGLRLVHTQSEMLTELDLDVIKRALPGVPVLNEYGCVEVGAMAYTCPLGRMHVSHDHVVLEIVDDAGRAVPAGQSGRILLTPLFAWGAPFLRYEVGDEGTWAREPCGCGRFPGMPVLERIDGRVFERIVAADGRTFSSGITHFLVRKAGGHAFLREYLCVQREPGKLELLCVVDGAWDDAFPGRLADEVRAHLDPTMTVEVRRVEHIERTGKKRSYFASELHQDGHVDHPAVQRPLR